ncbi:MAG: hypothetical protein K5905_20255 [Roseibium sp.]|uniref:dimethylsulfonioproprionate lyase family protein n=1 Tax=Roseibium sp. TaxID=1936156 RepID=UPI002637A712|nr:dimethylsulfonioproprionate lyase family protein [Roseibium sp.]MCV0427796.1 hypothetical protein [Roseibium sp.]
MEERETADFREAFNSVLKSIANEFSLEGRAGADLAAMRLRNAVSKPCRSRISQLKPLSLLQEVCNLPNAVEMADFVLECAPLLDWEQWEGRGLSKDISNRLFTTELLGPDGHIHDNQIRVGLLVSEPFTDYPVSNHSGEETYFVISGEAEWVVGSGNYQCYPPGSLIHHPSWEIHGRRTLSEPFLGAWRWSGDLDLSTFSVNA